MGIPEILDTTCSGEGCVICGAPCCQPCVGITGVLLARVACAARDCLIGQEDFAKLIHDADVFSGAQVVLAGAQ